MFQLQSYKNPAWLARESLQEESKCPPKNCKISATHFDPLGKFRNIPSLKLNVVFKGKQVSSRKGIYPHHVFHHYPSLGFCDSRNTNLNLTVQNTLTPRSIHHIQVFSIDLNPPKPEQQMGTTEVGFAKPVCRIAFEHVKHIHVCRHRQTHHNQPMILDVSFQQIYWKMKARILLLGHHCYHALAVVCTNTAHNPAPSPNSHQDP